MSAMPLPTQPPVAAETTCRPDKLLATARARAALLGGTLLGIENDRGDQVFVLTRWNLTRELPDLDAVDELLTRMEASARP
ncbi:MAG TPA: hypothetical protein VGM81_13305 [Burkholderiaceae bacterium]|jgi:hypothetical protein